jgi:protein tyrosine/serine phosphatase
MARIARTALLAPLFALLAAITGCGLGSADDYAPLTVTDNFRVLEPDRAYRSAQLDGESFRLVFQEYGIRTVINLRGANPDDLWYQNEVAAALEAGVKRIDVRMSASDFPPRDELQKLYDAFKTAEEPILIHCKAGADRTGAAAAMWRMVVQRAPKERALLELSPLYGHFEAVHPEMDALARAFEPRRQWIQQVYDPAALRAELDAR